MATVTSSQSAEPNYWRGILYLFLNTFFLSTIAVAVKWGLAEDSSPLGLLTWRYIMAAAILLAYFAAFQPQYLKIDRNGLFWSMITGLVSISAGGCYYFALATLEASVGHIVFVTVYLPLVFLLMWRQGERPFTIDWIRMILALFGTYLVVNTGLNINVQGLGLMLVSSIMFGVYIVLLQVKLREYPPQSVAIYLILTMAVVSTILYVATGNGLPNYSAPAWAAIVWLAIVTTVFARLLLYAGVQIIGSRQASLFAPVEAVMTVLFAVFLLGERLTPMQWVGGVIVFISMGLVVFRPKK